MWNGLRLTEDESGQALAESAIILATVALVVLLAVQVFGNAVVGLYEQIASQIPFP